MTFKVNLGDAPTWLAVLSAVYAGIQASRLLRIEQGRDRKTELREVSVQANQVAGWIQPEVFGEIPLFGWVNLKISNPSRQPVYDVEALVSQGQAPLFREKYALIPPDGLINKEFSKDLLSHFSPDLTYESFKYDASAREAAQKVSDNFNLSFSFTDSSGVRWTRDAKGNLEPFRSLPAS